MPIFKETQKVFLSASSSSPSRDRRRRNEKKTKEFEQQKSHFCVMIIYQKKNVRKRKIMRRNLVLHDILISLTTQ